jgi:uncharacterized protein YrrD
VATTQILMLQNIKALYGFKLAASDGDIGSVKDCYFDDHSWTIRYLVVDTGTWLNERKVLLSPQAFGPLDQLGKLIQVRLTRKQIEDSPSMDTHRPVSLQFEQDYYRYYGWPTYWDGGGLWGGTEYPVFSPPFSVQQARLLGHHPREDRHLRSTVAVTGYQIHAIDGELGSVSDFLMDDRNWQIRDLVVEAGHWYAGKKVYVAPSQIQNISYETAKVAVNLTKQELRETAEHRVAHASG